MGYTEDSSGDPLMKLPTFNTSEQVGRVDPSAIGQPMDYSDVFNVGAFATEVENTTDAQNTNEIPSGIKTYNDAISATSQPIGETPESLRQAERVENTKARIARRKARKEARGGGTRVGNFLRNTFN